MSVCPTLTQLPPNPAVITADLIDALIVSTYTRTVGTVVTVRCQPGLILVGPPNVTCMQSGFWSAEPYCTMSNEETTVTPTSNDDDENKMILIIVLSVVGFLVLSLICFVCIALYWGNSGSKKNKQYRDSTQFYLEEGSSHPYSVSRTGDDRQQRYHSNHSKEERHFHNDHHRNRYYQSNKDEYDERLHDDVDEHSGNYERRYQPRTDRRHVRCRCDRFTNEADNMRQAYSLNDLEDEKQYKINDSERDEEKEIRDNRRDRYLWRRRSSISNLNIPRPYYDANWSSFDAVYYGRDNSPYI